MAINSDVLPLPEAPQIAIFCPALIFKLTFLNTGGLLGLFMTVTQLGPHVESIKPTHSLQSHDQTPPYPHEAIHDWLLRLLPRCDARMVFWQTAAREKRRQ